MARQVTDHMTVTGTPTNSKNLRLGFGSAFVHQVPTIFDQSLLYTIRLLHIFRLTALLDATSEAWALVAPITF